MIKIQCWALPLIIKINPSKYTSKCHICNQYVYYDRNLMTCAPNEKSLKISLHLCMYRVSKYMYVTNGMASAIWIFKRGIKATVALLMRLHYEIVQQMINRLSKYLPALKVCIFTNVAVWLFVPVSFEWPVGKVRVRVFHSSHMHFCVIHFNTSTKPEMTL